MEGGEFDNKTMLSRLLPHFRALTHFTSKLHPQHTLTTPIPIPKPTSFHFSPPFFFFSSDAGDSGAGGGNWNLDDGEEAKFDSFFRADGDDVGDVGGGAGEWVEDEEEDPLRPWNLDSAAEDGGDVKSDLFRIDSDDLSAEAAARDAEIARAKEAAALSLQREEQALTAILEGSKRAFGDLISASGITDEMIDSLIALKDFRGVEGLPPLKELEELRRERGKGKSSEAEKERLKLEEAAKGRVRQVDDKGRAYGTGRRKCSVARVWIQPGDGKFVVNDRDFDVYFPIIDYRAALLRPFSETKTLGLWDVKCTVKGGGVTGQVGAIILGISRALQNWEPDLRPPLKAVGFLTRDPRMVERKKPGKAKARKSFQWVKR